MTINVLSNTRLLMQRLGFLKFICYLSELSTTIGSERLSKNFYDLIGPGNKIRIDLKETNEGGELIYKNLIDHISYNRLEGKYGLERGKAGIIEVEFQDILLSAGYLPSPTGSIYEMEKDDFTELALDLALIRKPTCSLTTSGSILKNLFISCHQKQFFEDFKSRKIQSNPHWYREFLLRSEKNILYLEQIEKIFFLYKLIKFDGVALYFAYKRCMKQCSKNGNYFSFKRHQSRFDLEEKWAGFGDLFGDRKKETDKYFSPNAGVFEDICRIYKRIYFDTESLNQLKSLKRFGIEIAANRSQIDDEVDNEKLAEGNFRTTIRHTANVRLEPLVDIGLLEKTKGVKIVGYEYKFTVAGIVFFSDFIAFMDMFIGEDINKLSYKDKALEVPLVRETLKIKDSAYFLFQYAIDIFLKTQYFCLINKTFNINAKKITNELELIDILKSTANNLPDIFGYRPIEDWLLISMFKNGNYVEIYSAEDFLKKSSKVILRSSRLPYSMGSAKLK